MRITLELPWPPSANTYWRRNGNCYFISKKGQDYREFVCKHCYVYQGLYQASHRLHVKIQAYPPDKRRRDLDNLLKGLLDSLQHAKLFPDDNQIDKLTIERMPEFEGKVVVNVELIR